MLFRSRCNGFLKRQPSQKEIQSPNKQPIMPASQACQKFSSPLPISAPSPAIITVPGRIRPTSASDSKKATRSTAIREYRADWRIKCSSNACIMCPSDLRSRDFDNPSQLRQAINCLNRLRVMTTFRIHHSLFIHIQRNWDAQEHTLRHFTLSTNSSSRISDFW